MTLLMLLRHAKAEPGGGGDDFERALTGKGEADARRLGRHLRRAGPTPGLALVSPATRTRQTFELVAAELAGPVAARYDDELFPATSTRIHDKVRDVAGPVGCLLVVGHNPAVAELAVTLTGDGDHVDRGRLASRFPPGSLAVLSFAGDDWHAVRAGNGLLQTLILPEDLAPE